METSTDVLIVGGGVVGRCAALYAARSGMDVVVVDRGVREEGASTGNAGMIVPSHLVPLASPGVIAQGLKWLLRRDSPFHIKPRADRRLLRWLWIFRRHCTAEHVERCVPVLRDLILESRSLFDELASGEAFARTGYRTDGLIMVHRAETYAAENAKLADIARRAGLDIEVLGEAELNDRAGVVPSGATGGVFFRQDAHIDPERFLEALRTECVGLGVRFVDSTGVRRIERDGARVKAVVTDDGRIEARNVVAAAGAWTAGLLRELDIELPLQPARGYSVTLPACERRPRIPMIVTDDKVTITPLPGAIRFGGTLELSGFDRSPSPGRVGRILAAAETYCPGASESTDSGDVWVGFRPASPDGLPYIGRAGRMENLFVATGHGMMGVTLAPVTGRMIAAMMAGERPIPDATPFDPARFS